MKRLLVVGVFVESEGKILILKRNPKTESHGGLWGIPAGKVAKGETEVKAVKRELFEETGIDVEEETLERLGVYNLDSSEIKIEFPTYRLKLSNKPNVILDANEHVGFRWVTPEECYAMKELIHDLDYLLEEV